MAKFSCWHFSEWIHKGWIFKSLPGSGSQAQSCRMLIFFCFATRGSLQCLHGCSNAQCLQPEFFRLIFFFFYPIVGNERQLGQSVPRFWFLGELFAAGPWGHDCALVDIEVESSSFLWVAVDGKSLGISFQDALACCSCGVMKFCRNADKLMTWKTSFHNENVRVWRPAQWLRRVLWFFPLIMKVLEFGAFLCSILWHFIYLA